MAVNLSLASLAFDVTAPDKLAVTPFHMFHNLQSRLKLSSRVLKYTHNLLKKCKIYLCALNSPQKYKDRPQTKYYMWRWPD